MLVSDDEDAGAGELLLGRGAAEELASRVEHAESDIHNFFGTIAREMDASYPAVHQWAKQKVRRVDLEMLGRFMDYFDVDLGEILIVEVEEVDED